MDDLLNKLKERIEELEEQKEKATNTFHQIAGALFEARTMLSEAIKNAPKHPIVHPVEADKASK